MRLNEEKISPNRCRRPIQVLFRTRRLAFQFSRGNINNVRTVQNKTNFDAATRAAHPFLGNYSLIVLVRTCVLQLFRCDDTNVTGNRVNVMARAMSRPKWEVDDQQCRKVTGLVGWPKKCSVGDRSLQTYALSGHNKSTRDFSSRIFNKNPASFWML